MTRRTRPAPPITAKAEDFHVAPIEALGVQGQRVLGAVRRTTPAEVARTCLMLCELAGDEDEARELVDAIVGSDPIRRAAVREQLAGLPAGRYADVLADRIVGKAAAL